jgi:hypothetical protein
MAPNMIAKFPQTPDNPWHDLQFPFDGMWLPNEDAALIGPRNFSTLTNLRYKDKTIWGINGYTKVNDTTALATYINIKNGYQFRSDKAVKSYTMVHAVDSGGQGRVYQNIATPGTQGDFDITSKLTVAGDAYHADRSTGLTGRFSSAPQNSMVYVNGEESMIYSGIEHRVSAAFLSLASGISDVSDTINNKLTSSYFNMSDVRKLIVMTTRPIQGVHFYVKTANAAASVLVAEYWDGKAFVAVSGLADGTVAVAGRTMGQSGIVSFTHTASVAKPMHYQELYLYAYRFTMGAATNADIYYATVDPAFQTIKDIWDGVYRQPIQFQLYSKASKGYADYTLQVNQSSDINTPIGAQLDGMVATDDALYAMFEEKVAGIRFTMLGNLLNTNTAVVKQYYWTGAAWTELTAATHGWMDGTINEGVTFGTTGTTSWNPPTDEEKQTLFGSLGYAYKFVAQSTLSGTKGSTAEVLVDLCSGIPAQGVVQPFDFACQFKNRVMLGGFSAGGEGNRMDFSIPNAPDVWNGQESSSDGINSLYFGGVEPITTAVQLYNRFGASVFAMLLVFKDMETYLLVGDSPEDFIIYPVSMVVGCPAPLTLSITEINMEGGENFTRNFAVWLSHSGPMIFDGAVIAPLKGIENYFDPNNNQYINWEYIKTARGWVDLQYKEYNLLIPTGTSTTPDTWLVYDLQRRKWYKKDTGSQPKPLSGWNVMDPATGEQFVYAGVNNGRVMQLESGTSWDGSAIVQQVKTGDFWPSNNLWDYTTLRKFKLVVKKIDSANLYPLNLNYYNNTEENPGQSVILVDNPVTFTDTVDTLWASAVTASFFLNINNSIQRVMQKTIDLNHRGWSHGFEFEVSTSDIAQGFQPIAWGVRYRVERKDDTSNIIVTTE